MVRRRTLITYLAVYFFAITTAIRFLISFRGHLYFWTITGQLATFLLLLASEPWLSSRSLRYTHLYLAVQTGIIIVLSLTTPEVDFFATLFLPLILQAMFVLPPRTGFGWVAVFTLVMAILMLYGPGWTVGLPLVLVNAIAYLFVSSYVAVIRQLETAREEAETARKESQKLLAELQAAYGELQIYAAQAEELAVAAERSRLARDLHDSVTQSLYSLTLFTQAARELAEAGNLERVKRNLARIADTAGQGLKEMRLLVYELRPLALEDEGLVGALQHRLDMVERRSGVRTRLLVELNGDVELTAAIEEALYRVAEEALNNALKHAYATSVTVRIAAAPDDRHLQFEVSDDGCGFDLDAVKDKGGLGLTSIRERVEGLGGEWSVCSAPGQGTRVKVTLEVKPWPKRSAS